MLIPRVVLLMVFGLMPVLLVPLLEVVPNWLIGVYVLAGAWRYGAYLGKANYPKAWIKVLLVVASVGALGWDMGSWKGLEPMVALLLLAFALKVTELVTVRDMLILILVAYFIVAAQFLFSQSLSATFLGIAEIWWITAVLIAVNYGTQARLLQRALRLSGTVLAQAIPLMLVLFFIFPRLEPFWAVPLQSSGGVTGVSDRMNPGDIANLSRSAALAFRAEFAGPVPPNRELYWRALVLDRQVGETWRASMPQPRRALPGLSPEIDVSITLEPTGQRWLPVLETPATLSVQALIATSNTAFASTDVKSDTRYRLLATKDNTFELLRPLERTQLLQLSAGRNPQSRALAERWRAELESDRDYVDAVLAYFRTQPFYYTLNPPTLGPNGVDEFLFSTQRGFCEHYAGAFTELMRAAGIPARVVTGYQGGELNPVSGAVVVRQYDAHAWSEVWLEEQGWVRVDPTAAVAPDRIEYGLEQALAEEGSFLENTPLSALHFRNIAWINAMRLRLDALSYEWQSWVLGFDRSTQSTLLTRLFQGNETWKYAVALASAWVLVMLPFAFRLWMSERPHLAPHERVLGDFLRLMSQHGFARAPGESLAHLQGRISGAKSNKAKAANAFLNTYSAYQYQPNKAQYISVGELKRLLRECKRSFKA